jgi:hypothetical protein
VNTHCQKSIGWRCTGCAGDCVPALFKLYFTCEKYPELDHGNHLARLLGLCNRPTVELLVFESCRGSELSGANEFHRSTQYPEQDRSAGRPQNCPQSCSRKPEPSRSDDRRTIQTFRKGGALARCHLYSLSAASNFIWQRWVSEDTWTASSPPQASYPVNDVRVFLSIHVYLQQAFMVMDM